MLSRGANQRRRHRCACLRGCQLACGGCWSGLLGLRAKPSKTAGMTRSVWHGSTPMLTDDPFEGGLPGYIGHVEQKKITVGKFDLAMEVWPAYRIGSSIWPSGVLLAQALATGLRGLPTVQGKEVVELGAGPGVPGLVCGKLGARNVFITDREELVPLVARNIELNGLVGTCHAEELDWEHVRSSKLRVSSRGDLGAVDIVIAADVIYFEEQDPFMDALEQIMAPGKTWLVLAYRERTPADRMYVEGRILPRLVEVHRLDYTMPDHGACEIYVGRLGS
mmetsp:Transcript_42631/g.92898  ORF Transcript_42631/g.92898 Transcript_42631/m.92898 type:complete len:278 (+) Transcript_42631:48-881(+)